MKLNLSALLQCILKKATFEAGRSSGPGGQNVNMGNSRATLRFPVECLPAHLPTRSVFQRTINGNYMIVCQEGRSFSANKERCMEKLRDELKWAERVLEAMEKEPSEEKKQAVHAHRTKFKNSKRLEKTKLKEKKKGRLKVPFID